jgi:diacylglycerol O-acyltransferase / wax synthase
VEVRSLGSRAVNERSERLSASDMSSLLAERGPIHVNVGGTIILDGKPPDFEELLAHVDQRLNLVPRFRQRVTHSPLRLSNPVWADDPRFDLRWHVRHTALPKPGSEAQLREFVGRIMSEPLDLTRPLWQVYLIEGLAGRHAVLSKTHHALVDGVSAVDVGTILLDPNRDGTEMPVSEQPWDPDTPSPEMLFVRAASDRIRRPLQTARRTALGALTMPRDTAQRVMRTAEGFAGLAAGGPTAPRTFLNREIGRDRRVAFVRSTLDEFKGARAVAEGATVNDVVLAVAAGGLRRFFERRSEPIPERLVALVPMSVRRPGDEPELGNRIATLLVALPLAEADPVRCLELIHAETARLKQSEQARAASLVIEATGFAPPTINRVLADVIARPLTWNLVITNVPGPQVPFYLLGRKVSEVYPFVPLSPQGHALSIGVLSFDGGVYFGLAGDRDLLTDIDDVASDLEAALAEQVTTR